eukprot:gnl/TRDRNA2_/TRDRNA2_166693_c0_seq1.p1 gnl/TRDRNA2_/TRDRNA2_166693_c0~~gnl/TRDRNA2_/TRDRNA2_166693_c0_seq1.p1  ORF type:complete len:183 (-),score=27.62 gnl/TRDRNA2_/TRDRNA2_166693_c0_seq1:42-509(-)
MMDQDGDKAIDFDEFLNGMVRLIRNSRFQETCMAQRARCQIKRQINNVMETQDIHTAQIRSLTSDMGHLRSDMAEIKQLLLHFSGKDIKTDEKPVEVRQSPYAKPVEVHNSVKSSDSSQALQPAQDSAAASELRTNGTAHSFRRPDPPGVLEERA